MVSVVAARHLFNESVVNKHFALIADDVVVEAHARAGVNQREAGELPGGDLVGVKGREFFHAVEFY